MRTSFHLVQNIFKFRDCGHNLEDIATVIREIYLSNLIYFNFIIIFRGCGQNLEDVAKVGGHEDICNIFRPYRCE
jgi:hypothetical protein